MSEFTVDVADPENVRLQSADHETSIRTGLELRSHKHLLYRNPFSPIPELFHHSSPASTTLDTSFCVTVAAFDGLSTCSLFGNAEEIPEDLT
ncbi:hypothetical protein PtrCC142_005595, partial [Pyrenophora tritici-repentis]